jgi:hypothetical protein
MSPALRLSSLVIVTLLVVTGCGSDDEGAAEGSAESSSETESKTVEPIPSDEPSAAETPKKKPQGTTIDITFSGDSVKPDGVRKKVEAGKPVTLRIKADRAGELHVHSSPEQEIGYPAGTSRQKLTIEQPGLVDVESHDLHKLVVQLEVR